MAVTQYTGYDRVSKDDAPTFMTVGTNDGIAYYKGMEARAHRLNRLGIPSICKVY